jgi:hypothetical protein
MSTSAIFPEGFDAIFPEKNIQVDRNLVLCPPRMAVLVGIEADLPGA